MAAGQESTAKHPLVSGSQCAMPLQNKPSSQIESSGMPGSHESVSSLQPSTPTQPSMCAGQGSVAKQPLVSGLQCSAPLQKRPSLQSSSIGMPGRHESLPSSQAPNIKQPSMAAGQGSSPWQNPRKVHFSTPLQKRPSS